MKSRELRALARESLQGKWGKGALLALVYLLVVYAISFVLGFIPVIGPIASMIISPALSFGFIVSLVKLSRDENPTVFEFLNNGFNSLGKLWAIIGRTILKLILPLLIFMGVTILSGILSVVQSFSAIANGSLSGSIFNIITPLLTIAVSFYFVSKALLYSLTSYILANESDLTAKEIVEKSEMLMKGNRWRFVCLELSFIGWVILGTIPFGIGLLWVLPYMEISAFKFYEELAGSINTATRTNYDNLA